MIFFTDVDECAQGINDCHVNATCNNTEGRITTAGVRMDLQEMDVRLKVRIPIILWWYRQRKVVSVKYLSKFSFDIKQQNTRCPGGQRSVLQ